MVRASAARKQTSTQRPSTYQPQSSTYQSQQQSTYQPQQQSSYQPQQQSTFRPQQPSPYEPIQPNPYSSEQQITYEPPRSTRYEPSYAAPYDPQQTTSYDPLRTIAYDSLQTTADEAPQSTYYRKSEPIYRVGSPRLNLRTDQIYEANRRFEPYTGTPQSFRTYNEVSAERSPSIWESIPIGREAAIRRFGVPFSSSHGFQQVSQSEETLLATPQTQEQGQENEDEQEDAQEDAPAPKPSLARSLTALAKGRFSAGSKSHSSGSSSSSPPLIQSSLRNEVPGPGSAPQSEKGSPPQQDLPEGARLTILVVCTCMAVFLQALVSSARECPFQYGRF